VSLQEQLYTVAAMALCGCAMGLLFDSYRVVAGYARMRRWLYPIFDLLYWAAALALVFPVLLHVNRGEVRVYVLLSILLGVSAYFGLASDRMVRGLTVLLRWTERTARRVARLVRLLIFRPIRFLVRTMFRLIRLVVRIVWAAAVFLGKIVLKWLRPFRLLYRQIPATFRRRLEAVPRLARTVRDLMGRLRRKR